MQTYSNIIVVTYVLYLLISVTLTVWVARTLNQRGAIFLVDAFHGNEPLARSVNHLLAVGFYLIIIGFVSLTLKSGDAIVTSWAAIELLIDKVGMLLLVLGVMDFFSLFFFSRIRRNSFGLRQQLGSPPPVAPDLAVPR